MSITLSSRVASAVVLIALNCAPAYAGLSCRELTRADVLGDSDVLARAASIARPWIDATQALVTAGRNGARPEDATTIDPTKLLAVMLVSQIANECEELPDDTVDDIVATHVKNTQQQLAMLPAKTLAAPTENGRPDSGNSAGNDPVALSAWERGAIVDHVRECWTRDAGTLDAGKKRVMLTVTTDTAGIVRKAAVADEDTGRMADPMFRAFAERAIRATTDPRCRSLPLPASMSRQAVVITFRFSP